MSKVFQKVFDFLHFYCIHANSLDFAQRGIITIMYNLLTAVLMSTGQDEWHAMFAMHLNMENRSKELVSIEPSNKSDDC